MKHSPAEIKFILHCYYSPEAIDDKGLAVRYVRDDILVSAPGPEGRYELTLKGYAWVEMMLSTPYPESAWVDPRTSERVGAGS